MFRAVIVCFAVTLTASGLCATCQDERDKIIQEYVKESSSFVPVCSDFSRDAHASHFSFAELNSGDYSWAILRDRMLKGIDDTRLNFGGSALVINSGYRNPVHNAGISGAATDSQHTHGSAVDFASSQTNWEFLQRSGKQAGACTEPQNLSGWGHVHVDWRGECPPNW